MSRFVGGKLLGNKIDRKFDIGGKRSSKKNERKKKKMPYKINKKIKKIKKPKMENIYHNSKYKYFLLLKNSSIS
jgi:hypothetical protein